MKIKVAIIGFGRMGQMYWEEMQKSGEWDIVYICDTQPAMREKAQKLAPPSTRIVEDEDIPFNDPLSWLLLMSVFLILLLPDLAPQYAFINPYDPIHDIILAGFFVIFLTVFCGVWIGRLLPSTEALYRKG